MQRAIDNRFYRSKAWRICREAYIKKCGGLCERCLANGIYKAGYIVHHKIFLTEDNYQDPSVALNFENLEYLCESCHNSIHFANSRRYKIEPNGAVTIT